MKLLLASALAVTAGWGWVPTDEAVPGRRATAQPQIEECEGGRIVRVECLPDGRCRIECEGPQGQRCVRIVECDAWIDPCCETTTAAASESCSGCPDCAPADCAR